MTYNIVIDQVFAEYYDLSLVQVSTLAAFLTLPTWTKNIAIDGDVWYQYSDVKMAEDYPLLFGDSKRCYKNIKILEDMGFVLLTKVGKERYVRFTSKCQSWGKTKEVQKRSISPKTDSKQSENGLKNSPKTDSNYNINIYTSNIKTNIDADGGFYDSSTENKNFVLPLNATVYDGKEEKNCAKKEEKTSGRKTSETKCLFADSKYSDYDEFSACFEGKEEFTTVDIGYYYNAVADWSASKGKKQNDWIATARNFMRKDKEQNKLHLKSYEEDNDKIESFMEFMQMGRDIDEKIRNCSR